MQMRAPLMVTLLALGAPGARADDAAAKAAALVDKADLIYRGKTSAAVFAMHIKTKSYERDYKIVAWDDSRQRRPHPGQDPRPGAVARLRHAQARRQPQALRSEVQPDHGGRPVDARRQLDGQPLLATTISSRRRTSARDYDVALRAERTPASVGRPRRDLPRARADAEADRAGGVGPDRLPAVRGGRLVLPVRADYFRKAGDRQPVRTIAFSDVAELGGRTIPRTMTVTVAAKPGESTTITYKTIKFDVAHPRREVHRAGAAEVGPGMASTLRIAWRNLGRNLRRSVHHRRRAGDRHLAVGRGLRAHRRDERGAARHADPLRPRPRPDPPARLPAHARVIGDTIDDPAAVLAAARAEPGVVGGHGARLRLRAGRAAATARSAPSWSASIRATEPAVTRLDRQRTAGALPAGGADAVAARARADRRRARARPPRSPSEAERAAIAEIEELRPLERRVRRPRRGAAAPAADRDARPRALGARAGAAARAPAARLRRRGAGARPARRASATSSTPPARRSTATSEEVDAPRSSACSRTGTAQLDRADLPPPRRPAALRPPRRPRPRDRDRRPALARPRRRRSPRDARPPAGRRGARGPRLGARSGPTSRRWFGSRRSPPR